MNLKIEISPIIEAYEEIYFAKAQGHYFKSPQSRGFFLKFVSSLVVTIIVVLLSISNFVFNDSPYLLQISLMILFCVGQILTIIFFLGFIQKVLEIKTWKKQINEYLKRLKTTKIYKIVLTDSYIMIIQDENENVLNWSCIVKAEINNEFISLLSQDYFLIPSKCIERDSYTKLKKAISEKLKNAITEPKLH